MGNRFDEHISVPDFIQQYSSSLNLLQCHRCCIVLTGAGLSFSTEAPSALNKSNINFLSPSHIHPPLNYTSNRAGYFVHSITVYLIIHCDLQIFPGVKFNTEESF